MGNHRDEIRDYYAMMAGAYNAMSDEKRRELEAWEKINLGHGNIGTGDWPGWIDLIGEKPINPKILGSYKKAIIPPEIRWQVWERDNFTCLHCGSRKLLTVDHIHPEVKGGDLSLDNLQTLCKSCNSRKGTK